MFYLYKAAPPQVQAYNPNGNRLAYATTKGAIVTLTKALAQLVLEKGVPVNAVAPGPVWTPLIPLRGQTTR